MTILNLAFRIAFYQLYCQHGNIFSIRGFHSIPETLGADSLKLHEKRSRNTLRALLSHIDREGEKDLIPETLRESIYVMKEIDKALGWSSRAINGALSIFVDPSDSPKAKRRTTIVEYTTMSSSVSGHLGGGGGGIK